MKTLKFAPLFASLIVCASATADEKRSFPSLWKTGRTYLQSMTMDQTTNFMGQGDTIVKMNIDMSAVPADGATPGTTDVTMTYTKMEMKATMGGQELPGTEDALGEIVGKSMVVTFSKDGEVLDVSTEGLGSLNDNPIAAQIMGEENMKQVMAQSSLLGRPGQPVGPGESWDFRIDYPNPMLKMVMTGTYTYEGDEEREGAKVARLSIQGTIDTAADESAEGEDPQGMQAMMRAMGLKIGASKITGTAYYDIALQNFTHTEMDMDMTMSMVNPADGNAMEMPVKTRVVQALSVQGE